MKAENSTPLTADGAPLDLARLPCPTCLAFGTLKLEHRMECEPIGTYSLAGVTPKLSARQVAWLVCSCGAEFQGKR